jgi:hypothetical protein
MRYPYIYILLFITYCSFITQSYSQKYFTNESLRIDFVLTGNNSTCKASLFELKKEPHWSGSSKQYIDSFNYGEFRIVVKDSMQKIILYSRGFCTLFEEWQTTDEAKYTDRAFFQSITCPFPTQQIYTCIEKRNDTGDFEELLTLKINPNQHYINKKYLPKVKIHKLIDNGNPANCVDIVFISEGYTHDQLNKFHYDVKKFNQFLFSQPPFKKYKKKINIWMVDAISPESGITDPRANIWKNTILNASFNTLNSDRYLASKQTFTVRDYASLVPYDQIYVLANTTKYGGGGIYNHFSLTSTNHKDALNVFIHEFGHSFAGLGDEYYTSEVSYRDFYSLNLELWQPNLTTMVNLKAKWKNMIRTNVPIPTPAIKKYQNKVGEDMILFYIK